LKRTIGPKTPGKEMMLNYYDRNGAQRWGKITEETKSTFIVYDIVGEKTTVPKSKVICQKEKSEPK